jgi:hypothetical protein
MTTTIISHQPGTLQPEDATTRERERLIDARDALVARVRTQKTELTEALERRHKHGCGSAKAMLQMAAAITSGKSQIALIDLQLESIGTP